MTNKRLQRKKQTAEDFTPPKLSNEILDKLEEYSPESFEETKTFLDPACGNGNLLVEVLKRKLSKGHNILQAISTLYGCDIMEDNIQECRYRLLQITNGVGKEIVEKQIIWVPLSEYKNGSLDYDFVFNNRQKLEEYKEVKEIEEIEEVKSQPKQTPKTPPKEKKKEPPKKLSLEEEIAELEKAFEDF